MVMNVMMMVMNMVSPYYGVTDGDGGGDDYRYDNYYYEYNHDVDAGDNDAKIFNEYSYIQTRNISY